MVLAPQLLILRASGRLVGKQEVQAGLVVARIQVADMLDRGDGYVKDQPAAVEWYQAAAEQGDVYAMTQLGARLRLGKGVAWSEAQAMQWFAKAAQQRYVPAETSLATGYENGLGQDSGQGKQDYRQAAYWFGQAADQDDGYALLNLGVMYEKGWGVPQNLERAKQLYARAAGSSNTAVANLGKQYLSDVPDSAPPDRTPQRTAVSSRKTLAISGPPSSWVRLPSVPCLSSRPVDRVTRPVRARPSEAAFQLELGRPGRVLRQPRAMRPSRLPSTQTSQVRFPWEIWVTPMSPGNR